MAISRDWMLQRVAGWLARLADTAFPPSGLDGERDLGLSDSRLSSASHQAVEPTDVTRSGATAARPAQVRWVRPGYSHGFG